MFGKENSKQAETDEGVLEYMSIKKEVEEVFRKNIKEELDEALRLLKQETNDAYYDVWEKKVKESEKLPLAQRRELLSEILWLAGEHAQDNLQTKQDEAFEDAYWERKNKLDQPGSPEYQKAVEAINRLFTEVSSKLENAKNETVGVMYSHRAHHSTFNYDQFLPVDSIEDELQNYLNGKYSKTSLDPLGRLNSSSEYKEVKDSDVNIMWYSHDGGYYVNVGGNKVLWMESGNLDLSGKKRFTDYYIAVFDEQGSVVGGEEISGDMYDNLISRFKKKDFSEYQPSKK